MKLFAVATMALALVVSNANAENLRIGISADFPPWGFTTSSGEITGFERDLGDAICQKIGASCSWFNQAFDGLLPSLQIGKFDMLISGFSITEERAKNVDFSIPYGEAPYQFAALSNSALKNIKTTGELENALNKKVIGVQSGTTHEFVIKANFKDADVRIYERNEQMVDDILVGRLDAALLEITVWEGLLKNDANKIERFGPILTGADYPEFGDGMGIVVKKGNRQLKERLDTAINDLINDGTVTQLSQKYFGYDVSFKKKNN